MAKKKQFGIEIDKLTRSVENTISGDSFRTEVLPVTENDINCLKAKDWLFNWKDEYGASDKKIFKLIIADSPSIIQGLISIEDRADHFFMHLIESSKFNRGTKKVYFGVPGNLVAFACMLSFRKGYEGYVSFESKTKLIVHYQKALGAKLLFGNYLTLDSVASEKLVKQYFPDFQ